MVGWLTFILGAFALPSMLFAIRSTMWLLSIPLPSNNRAESTVCVPLIWLGVLAAGLATYRLTRHATFDQTRFRKCGYILRGITEPRCPECGERI